MKAIQKLQPVLALLLDPADQACLEVAVLLLWSACAAQFQKRVTEHPPEQALLTGRKNLRPSSGLFSGLRAAAQYKKNYTRRCIAILIYSAYSRLLLGAKGHVGPFCRHVTVQGFLIERR